MDNSINLSRDVIDLARNVKKEADAISELNSTLRRANQSSSKKNHHISSSVDRAGAIEGPKEVKQLLKQVKELESKIIQYEEIIEELNSKLEKKDKIVAELEENLKIAEQRASRKIDQLLIENKELNGQVLKLGQNLRESNQR
jgi:methyl-accepting chemotaxis protein